MTEIIKKINSDPSQIPLVEEWVLERLAELNVSAEKLNLVGMAVSEAISNSIIHGNNANPAKFVTVTINKKDDIIDIKFKDEGKGFKPKEIPDPTLPENMMKESGRGIHIMRTVLDDLTYNFTENGTEVILRIKTE